MANSIELEEMVVRFVADQTQYVKQVKEVQKVTEDAADTANKAAKSFQKAIPVAVPLAQRAVKQTMADAGVSQDSAGKWRNAKGQFATAQELRAAAAAMGDGSASARQYAEELTKVANALDKATTKQTQHNRSVRETVESQSMMSKVMSGAAGMLAPIGAMMSVGALAGNAMKSVSLAAQAESIEITFQTIIGDAAKAKVVLDDLRAFADWSPFNTGEVMEAGKMMMAMGTSANTVVDVMMTMGDVAGALNIPIKDLTYLMGTLQSVGRATTVDLNQFALRGIPIWRELAEMMYGDPKAVDKVRKAVEAGQISFDVVDKAFKKMTSAGGMFYQGMEKQAKGLEGLWATFQSETENVLKTVGETIIEQLSLKYVLDGMTQLTKSFKEAVGTVSGQLKGMMTLKQLWIEVSYNAKKFVEWVQPLLPLLLTVLGILNPFAGAVILLGIYWREVSAAVTQFFKYADPILRELKYTVINLATAVRDGLVVAFNWAAEKFKGLVEYVRGLGIDINWDSFRTSLMDAIVFFEFSFHRMDLIADVAWKAIRYGAVKLVNDLTKNIFYVMAAVLFPQILLGMGVNWNELLVAMLVAAGGWSKSIIQIFVGGVLTAAMKMQEAFKDFNLLDLLTGKVQEDLSKKLGVLINDSMKEVTANALKMSTEVKVTPNFSGIKVEGLERLEKITKTQLDESVEKLKGTFGEFKTARNAKIFWQSLADVGKEVLKAGGQPLKSAAGEIGKDAGKEMGQGVASGMKAATANLDGILRGSLAEAVRTQEYLDYLRVLPGGKGFNPNLPAGAVPFDKYVPPVQAGDPMGTGQANRDKVVELLTVIAGGIGKLESKPPVLAGPAGL